MEEVRPMCIARRSVEADASGATYDRREALDCLPYTFAKGQLFTQVAFYLPDEREEAGSLPPFQMHSSPLYLIEWRHPKRFPAAVSPLASPASRASPAVPANRLQRNTGRLARPVTGT